MTMQNYARGAEKSRRSESSTSTSAKTAILTSSHSQSRSNAYSTNGIRNGHTTTGSTAPKGIGGAYGYSSNPAEHSGQSRKYSSGSYHQTDRIEEEYHQETGQREQDIRHHHSNNNFSPFSRNDTTAGRTASRRPEGTSSSVSLASVDSNCDNRLNHFSTQFKTGIKLIQQAYEEKYQTLLEERDTWKCISEERSAQMAVMSAELSRVEENYAALQREMAQLEIFRKAIVTMVDQHSGVSLSQLERSILETIEADVENVDTAGFDAVADADTSSFILDGDVEPIIEQPPHQTRYVREDQKTSSNIPTNSSSVFKSSLHPSSSRPRASTESFSKRPSSTQNPSHSTNQAGYSPSRQSTTSITRNNSSALLDGSPNGHKKMQKSESSDNLKNKRNTISSSSSSRPIYPNTPLTNSSAKRHSSASPLSPRARATVPSSRTASTLFSSNSTPSTSPRQTSGNINVPPTIAESITTRSTRTQQQKEYSLNVKNSMAQLAGLSGASPLNSTPRGEKATSGLHSKSSSSNNSQTTRRSQRSGSDSQPASSLSPAASKIIRQQEQQQMDEESEYLQSGVNITRRNLHSHTDDEDYHRSITLGHGHVRSSVSESSRLQRGHPSETGHESAAHSQVAGYESSSKYDTQRHRNNSYSEKHNHRTLGASNEDSSKRSNGGVDASAFTMLYKEIRDSMDTTSFGLFAKVVAAFNEGDKTTEETLEEVGKIVKDRSLNQRFRDLIHQAIADKENQLDNEAGNGTIEGDITLEIDHSLLLDDEQDLEDEALPVSLRNEGHGGDESLIYKEGEEEEDGLLNDETDLRDPGESILEEIEQTPLESEAILNSRRTILSDDEIDENDEENESDNTTNKSIRKKTT
ncbi:hypothetical protein BGZ76_011188 [Entomortierella beljakovae]|nr:hypothetical protein BGZ76_011188 [Entomortierella beljakovae]